VLIAILAGGASLRGVDLSGLSGTFVIGVNEAWRGFEVSETVTIDTDDLPRRIKACPGKFIAGVPEDYGTPQARYACDRVAKIEGAIYVTRKMEPGLSEDPKCLHCGENSSYAALNRAYQYKPRKIVLFGLDLFDAGKHWHEHSYPSAAISIPASFANTAKWFETAIPQLERNKIEVINASPNSRLNCFRKVSPEAGIKICNGN
jgi:hypothetical protein